MSNDIFLMRDPTALRGFPPNYFHKRIEFNRNEKAEIVLGRLRILINKEKLFKNKFLPNKGFWTLRYNKRVLKLPIKFCSQGKNLIIHKTYISIEELPNKFSEVVEIIDEYITQTYFKSNKME